MSQSSSLSSSGIIILSSEVSLPGFRWSHPSTARESNGETTKKEESSLGSSAAPREPHGRAPAMKRVFLDAAGRKKILTTGAQTMAEIIADVEGRLGIRVAELRPGLRSPRQLEVSVKCWREA